MTIEVAMPVYRPSKRLEAVLTALALQTYKDFYITIYNDTNPDETEEIKRDEEIIEKMRKKHGMDIRLFQNDHNLGYMKNMHQIFDKATGDIIFLLADDDIVSYDCIEMLAKAFDDSEVGCVSRPYYWFTTDFKKAVRFAGHMHPETVKVDICSSPIEQVTDCLTEAGQLSGLGFRKAVLLEGEGYPFIEDMFTAHVYPFLFAFKNYKCALMPKPTIAVSINTSQCQNDIYDPSPSYSWIKLYNTILKEDKFEKRRKEIIEKSVTTDFLGLAEIKNYGTYKELFTEIGIYVKYRPLNLLNIKFYIFSLGSIIIPRKVLKWMVEYYKNNILSKKLMKMDINYKDFPFDEVKNMWEFPKTNERSMKNGN